MTAKRPGISIHFARALLPSGWATDVHISSVSGRITGVKTGVPAEPGDSRHAIGLPGMPNLHSHAFQRAMAGDTEHRAGHADSFWSWREAMYHFTRRITPDQLAAIAAMAQIEMLETGFTRVGEFHYLHHTTDGTAFGDPAAMSQAIFEAAEQTGIGLTHLPVFYAHAGFGGQAPETDQRRFVSNLDSFARLFEACRDAARPLPDAVVGIAPHSLRAVNSTQLAALAEMAQDAPLHIHIAEQSREVAECLTHTGARPVEYLFDTVAVGSQWCLVHATHISPPEVAAVASSGAVVGLCPITEANLGDGIFPADDFLAAGGIIGVGSDSNVRIDMTEELRLLEYGQRLTRQARNVLASDAVRSTGRRLFDNCVLGGGRALGSSGGIEVGRSMDLIALDPGHPALFGKNGDAILDSLIFAGGRSLVRDVWRAGRQVVESGRHVARKSVEVRYRRALEELLA